MNTCINCWEPNCWGCFKIGYDIILKIGIALLLVGCTVLRIPVTPTKTVTYIRVLQKMHIEITDPETGVKILLINSDSGSDTVKQIAPIAGAAITKGMIP